MTTFPLESILDWLIKSTLCLLVLLGVYRLWLENQPMHRLKRAYLLGTLLLSLAGPFVSLQVPTGWLSLLKPVQLVEKQVLIANEADDGSNVKGLSTSPGRNVPTINVPEPTSSVPYWLWPYGAVTTLMLARFIRNLYVLLRQVWTSPAEPYYGATLVKLPGNALPYTFLHYLFVSSDAYERGEIEAELLDHELAHIQQRHSLDVLLVEIVLCFCWFNPLVFWLKRAMQRNHEFLADEAVNQTYLNVPGYQHLLLSKVASASPKLSLTSTLTFDTTKQRLLMMTKQTSPARAWLAGGSTVVFFVALTIVLTGAAPAQPPIFPLKSEIAYRKPVPLLSVVELESRFGNVLVNATSRELGIGQKVLFKDLTPEQKTRVIHLEGRLPGTFTEEEFNALKNAKRYSIWVDGKRVRHFERTTLQATDIVTYNIIRAYKSNRRPTAFHYKVDLLTDSAANAYAKELQASPRLLLLTAEQMEKQQARAAK
ncbi:M56 family metallopeptidase [Fibrivirga algicola]|uniref:M56 family metallopeptidase n=1 Tax=Fibrivirga algicola TaxID=2950420 RepID=A0ABX0QG23_9BACT|nr:M56 family metallopeptidase [Fibrivirga algicola]NID09678.1 M56 family metallopeptidase [Fibrivirga algicola]